MTSCYAREQEFICAQEKNSPSEEKERKYRWNHKEIFIVQQSISSSFFFVIDGEFLADIFFLAVGRLKNKKMSATPKKEYNRQICATEREKKHCRAIMSLAAWISLFFCYAAKHDKR